MSKKQTASAIKFLKDADDVIHLVTGQRLFKQLLPRTIELFGEDLIAKITRNLKPLPLDPHDPYSVLEVRPDASNLVVTAVFRAKVRTLHPDTGSNPDPKEFQRVNEAYRTIMAARNAKEPGQ